MTAWRIPLSDLDLGPDVQAAVARVVASNWLTLGGEVAAFEREFAAACGAPEAVAVSSGTAALQLACAALGVGPGAEVIVPTLTFVATASAVAHAGGTPVFADSIGPEDLTLDPDDVERRITPATRGVVCMHYGGFPCRMDALLDLCERHGLFLVEDAAHAPGASWEGRALGTIGDAGCFSFFGNKNLTTGEGGMVVARQPAVLEQVRLLRSHGMTTSSWDRFRGHAAAYEVARLGHNFRLAELPAAVGSTQLARLPESNRRRAELLERYRDRLQGIAELTMPFAGRTGAAHLAAVLVAEPDRRDPLRDALAAAGIQSSVHYQPVHLFAHFRQAYGCGAGDLPVAEGLAERIVTLPLYPTLAEEQVDEVCGCVASFFSERRAEAQPSQSRAER